METYLGQKDAWRGFHEPFLPAARQSLSPQVSPACVVQLD